MAETTHSRPGCVGEELSDPYAYDYGTFDVDITLSDIAGIGLGGELEPEADPLEVIRKLSEYQARQAFLNGDVLDANAVDYANLMRTRSSEWVPPEFRTDHLIDDPFFWPRVQGTLQAIGGAGEAVIGAPLVLVPDPVTTGGGLVLVYHGVDNWQAGTRAAIWGEPTETETKILASGALRQLGVPEGVAEFGGTAVDLAPSIAAGVIAGTSIRAAQPRTATVEIPDELFSEGTFSITKQKWETYPEGLPRPEGPFRILEGDEYIAARRSANITNDAIRDEYGLIDSGLEIHEIQPIKFNGSPTDFGNKILLDEDFHRQIVTPWWYELSREIKGK